MRAEWVRGGCVVCPVNPEESDLVTEKDLN